MAPARATRARPLSPRVIRPASPRNPPPVNPPPMDLPQAPPVTIEAPVGVKLNIPGRHPAMPDIYRVQSHPDVVDDYAGNIYVIYGDTTQEGHAKLLTEVGDIDPYGGTGFMGFDPKDKPGLVFARNMYGPPGQADALLTWGLGPNEFSDEEKKARATLRDDILGAEEDLTANETAFERSPRKVPVHPDARAYTIGPNIQHPRQLLQPAAGLKRTDEDTDDAHLKFCNDFATVIGQCSVKALHSHVPNEALEILEAQVDSINMPRIGPQNNTTTPAFQLNLASAVNPNETREDTPDDQAPEEDIEMATTAEGISQLGAFGAIHIDGHDLTAGFTVMHMLSKDDARVKEQRFYLVESGIYWVLHGDCSYGFSGLRMHGGSPPEFKTAQPADAPPYIRMNAVAYCPTHFFDGNASWSFGAAPLKGKQKTAEVFRIAPEMQIWSYDSFFKERPFTNSPNMISDGISIMDPQAYLDFMARGIVQFASYLILQAPAELLVRLDRDAILAAISLVKDDQRIAARPWPRGPGWSGKECAEGPLSQEMMEALKNATTWQHYRALQASDDSELRKLPFGNKVLDGSIGEAFKALCRESGAGIPICALAEEEDGPIGGTPQKRRTVFGKARAGKSSKSKETETAPKEKGRPRGRKRKAAAEAAAEAEAADGPPAKRTRQRVTYDQDSECDSDTEVTAPLLQALDLAELERLFKELGTYVLEAVGEDLDSWEEFLDAVESDESENAVALLGNAAAHLRFMKARRDATDILSRLQNQELLLSRMAMWKWIEGEVDNAWNSVETSTEHWMKSLCEEVIAGFTAVRVSTGVVNKQFNASIYVPSLSIPTDRQLSTMEFPARRVNKADTRQVKERLMQILSNWLDFDSDFERGRPASHLVFRLVAAYTPTILLHWPVIHACDKSLRRFVFEDKGDFKPSFAKVERWCTENLQVADDATRQLLTQIDLIVDGWRTEQQRILPNRMTRLVQDALARFTSSPSEKTYRHEFLIRLLEPLYPLARDPSFSLPKPPKTSSKAIKTFYTAYRAFLKHMVSMDDKKIPWRDLATSRLLILGNNGPFASSHLRTKEGLFSALIHRGITHNCQFLHSEQHIFFNGLDDWNTIYTASREALEDSGMKEDDIKKYFCNGCAYGVWTRRSVEHAPTYAAATDASHLTSWLLDTDAEELPTFATVYKLFLNGRVNGNSAFPGFGPLQAYLLASDYAIAGVVRVPTYKEMGELLWTDLKGKGAMSGLGELGYTDFKSAKDVADAFEEVDKLLRVAIPENLRRRMNFNVFTTEHILCKVNRLNIAPFKNMLKARGALSSNELDDVVRMWREYWQE